MNEFDGDTATDIVLIGELARSRDSIIQVTVGDFGGRSYAYVKTIREGRQRGGFCFGPAKLREFLTMLESALKAVEDRAGS